jgi:hypothetical protein
VDKLVIVSMTEASEAWKQTACNNWASHLPLLRTCGWATRVLELGMGRYSTPTFLNSALFPFLDTLVSVESDRGWIQQSEDARHKIHIHPEPIEPFLDDFDLENFDLIFVDNSDKAERRIETLKYISSRQPRRASVLVHDWERYHAAVTGFRFGILDDRQLPHTALVWGR